jgi:GT2 family glycosyltransferase
MNTISARNKIVYKALTEKFDYIFFMDSDMEFPSATLDRLLRHKKDIAGGFYLRKKKGYLPNAFKLGFSNGTKLLTEFVTDFKEVEAIGTGCLLIKTEVFNDIPKPWFEYEVIKDSPDCHMATEDVVFCRKAKKAGYKIYCDGSIACGHIGGHSVTPAFFMNAGQAKVEPI